MLPLYDDVPSERFPFINYALIIVSVAVFLVELSAGDALLTLVNRWAVLPHYTVGAYVALWHHGTFSRRLLTPLTAMFMHGGWLHLLGNMWFLFIFGDNVEGRLGHWRYLLFYVFGGLVANAMQIAIDPGSRVPELGASGAIAATLGAYMVMFPYSRVLTLIFLGIFITTARLAAPWFLGLWFLMQALSGVASLGIHQQGGVAWFAHIGGFAMGFLVGAFFRRPPRYRYVRRYYSNRR